MSVFLANEQADYRVDEPSLARLARLVMDAEGVEESEISLLLVDRSVMTDLNERYMGEDRPTDVLAFPIDGPSPASGPPDGPSGPRGFAADRLSEADDEDDLDDEEDDDAPWLLGDIVLCPGVRGRAGDPQRPEPGRRAGAADRARHPPPVRVRPRRTRGGAGHADPHQRAAGPLARR